MSNDRSPESQHLCLETPYFIMLKVGIVREPAVGLIKWLRPKGLNVCSYVERYAEFKNQTLKVLCATEYTWGK